MKLVSNKLTFVKLLSGLAAACVLTASAWAQQAAMADMRKPAETTEGSLFRGGISSGADENGYRIAFPNGKYTEYHEDLAVKVPGGFVRWTRDFNGNQWRFNSNWNSLQFEFDPVLKGFSSSGGSGGGGSAAIADIQPATPPEYFGGATYPGTDGMKTSYGILWAIARNGAWFQVDANYCSFSVKSGSRFFLKPVFAGDTPACPTNRFNGQLMLSSSGTGEGGAAIETDPEGGIPASLAGFRWEDRIGNWIEYDRTGRIQAYGDKTNMKVTMVYSGGKLTGVKDTNGRLVMTIEYAGDKVWKVSDVPAPGDTKPVRTVVYGYDGNNLHTVTDVRGYVTTYDYDAKSRLKKVTDAENRFRTLDYGPTSRVITLTDKDGSVSNYEYDFDKTKKQFIARTKRPEVAAGVRRVETSTFDIDGNLLRIEVNGQTQREFSKDGRVQKLINGRGKVTEFTLNEFNQMQSVAFPDGKSKRNSFDATFLNLVDETDENGVTTHYDYYDNGLLKKVTEAKGTIDERVTTYDRDSAGRVIKVTQVGRTESNGIVTPDAVYLFEEFDAYDNPTKVTDPENKVWRYEYNRLGEATKETDPKGKSWVYEYDADGNLLTSKSPLGHLTTYEYDKVGNSSKMINPRQKVFQLRYNGRDQLAKRIDPYLAEYTTEYNAAGRTKSVSDASGKAMQFEYDAYMRLARAKDGKGNDYALEYLEADGRDVGMMRPSKIQYPTFQRLLKHDDRDRALERTELDGTEGLVQSYSYDGVGRRKTQTNTNGKTTYTDYNAFGQITRRADSLGNAQRALFDARGNLIEVTDPNGKKTKFEFDRRDLLVKTTDPLGKITQYVYTDSGWLQDTILPNGKKLGYTYDDSGRLQEQREYAAGGALVKTTTFHYDEDDNLKDWSDGSYSAALNYDDAGRLMDETVSYGAFSLKHAYTYYPNNQVKTYTGPDNITITYGYDALGELERVTIPGEGDIAVTEWQWAARKKVLLPGGTEQRFDYDGYQSLKGLKVVSPGQATVFEMTNAYGKLHEVKDATRDAKTKSYTYDDGNRLTTVTASPQSESYTVDAAANRLSDSRVAGGTWVYDDASQLKQRGTVSYDYDDNGNLTKKTDTSLAEPLRTTNYVYDAFNRLVEVRNGSNAVVASYTYDPFDRRLSKQLGSGGALTYYLHGGTGLLAEANLAGAVQVSYGWHPAHDDSTYPLYARVVDPAGGSGAFRYVYFHNDQLGTPQRITDKSGAVVWSADYDASGKATVSVAPMTGVVSNLRYPGQYFDAETGLHYNTRRYYDPDTGRYITRDPIGFSGGPNLYAYVGHNPINMADPSGEILPCLAVNYLRCMATCMLISSASDYFMNCGNVNWGDNAKDCAVDCLLDMLPLPNPCGKLGKYVGMAMGVAGGLFSFPGDTMVHVKPADATAADAQAGKSVLKPISELQPGDVVLALSEWKERGSDSKVDARLSYEKVTDVRTNSREQDLVHLQLVGGETITSTAGHSYKTPEGWRDAILLKRGGKLLLKAGAEDGPERLATIADVHVEKKTIQVFSLEVANAHTFYVGKSGYLVHNVHGNSRDSPLEQWIYRIFDKATDATIKYGVANCKSKHSRPKKQLGAGQDYEHVKHIPAGPGARGKAYDSERDHVTDYANQHGGNTPPGNDLPRPW